MRSTILLFLFLFSTQLSAKDSCENLAGDWETRRYDERLESYIVTQSSYLKDNTWSYTQTLDGLVNDWARTESGTWECDGSDFITHVKVVDNVVVDTTFKYKILNLDYNFFRFQVATENCSETISDCHRVIFEAIRINNDS